MMVNNNRDQEVNLVWFDEEDHTFPDGEYEISGLHNWSEEEQIISDFVDQQEFFSINSNGKVERNVIANEFSKYCYVNKIPNYFKRDELVEMVKREYWIRSKTKLNKQDFFESLKPQKFKYKW